MLFTIIISAPCNPRRQGEQHGGTTSNTGAQRPFPAQRTKPRAAWEPPLTGCGSETWNRWSCAVLTQWAVIGTIVQRGPFWQLIRVFPKDEPSTGHKPHHGVLIEECQACVTRHLLELPGHDSFRTNLQACLSQHKTFKEQKWLEPKSVNSYAGIFLSQINMSREE